MVKEDIVKAGSVSPTPCILLTSDNV
jgi:hypothetical protein